MLIPPSKKGSSSVSSAMMSASDEVDSPAASQVANEAEVVIENGDQTEPEKQPEPEPEAANKPSETSAENTNGSASIANGNGVGNGKQHESLRK